MPPQLSGGEAPLLSPCNLSWVLPSTLRYSQPIAQMPMYVQTSRLRLQNNKNVAAQVLLYCMLCVKQEKASAVCCCWPEHHTLTALRGFSAGATTDLKQIWSQLTILTTHATTTALMSDQALMPAVESCFAVNYFLLTFFIMCVWNCLCLSVFRKYKEFYFNYILMYTLK